MTVLRIGDDQRRARLAWRHRLAPQARSDDAAAITDSVVALHASDPATVHLSVATRMATPIAGAAEDALYDERSLVRMLGMRRTMFVVPTGLAPVVQAASSNDVAAAERRKVLRALEADGVQDGPDLLRALEDDTLDALAANGGAYATELSSALPQMSATVPMGSGRWRTDVTLGSRVLLLLAADGRIVRGPPRGSWRSSQYRWVPTTTWLGRPLDDLDAEAARARLAGHWLAAFGPATFEDLVWWTGWTRARSRRALASLDTTEVGLDDGSTGYVMSDDTDEVSAPPRWAALLPGLDPTAMGWRSRDWYLDPRHVDTVVDRNGNIGPTVWADGCVVGGWIQRPDSTIVYRMLDDVDAWAAVDDAVERLQDALAGTPVIPRFRSPLDRELSA